MLTSITEVPTISTQMPDSIVRLVQENLEKKILPAPNSEDQGNAVLSKLIT